MRRILILAAMLFAGSIQGECATFFPPLKAPVNQNQMLQDNAADTVDTASLTDSFTNPLKESYSNLGKVEQALFGKSFGNQNINNRLSRIEKALFTTTYPNSTSSQRIDNIISNFNQINKNPNISKNTLSKLESKVFNQTFVQNSAQRRIERLEEQVFGAVQSGDLEARCKTLQIAAKSFKNNDANFDDDFSDPMAMQQSSFSTRGGGLGRFLSNFSGGAMTGFTPSIGTYSPYSNFGGSGRGFSNPFPNANPYLSRHGMEQGYNSNHGYSNGSRDYGSGASVTILD